MGRPGSASRSFVRGLTATRENNLQKTEINATYFLDCQIELGRLSGSWRGEREVEGSPVALAVAAPETRRKIRSKPLKSLVSRKKNEARGAFSGRFSGIFGGKSTLCRKKAPLFVRKRERFPQAQLDPKNPGPGKHRAMIRPGHQTGRSMLARRLALAIAVLAGLIGSQGPEFAQQYRQRLGGALEELNRIVSEFDADSAENLTRAEGLSRLERNDDPLARERGADMSKAIERAKRLNEQIQAMNSAGPLMRLYVVATTFDPEIARSTLDNYEPAEPLSLGALVAGSLAALWGWAATLLIAWPFRRRSRLRAARAQSRGADAG